MQQHTHTHTRQFTLEHESTTHRLRAIPVPSRKTSASHEQRLALRNVKTHTITSNKLTLQNAYDTPSRRQQKNHTKIYTVTRNSVRRNLLSDLTRR